MGNVVDFPTFGEIPPDDVLSGAKEAGLDTVIVIGWRGDRHFYFSSSTGDIASQLLMLRLAERDALAVLD